MKQKPLTLLRMIAVSSVLVACIGAYIKYGILRPMELYQDKGIMELPFLILTDDGLRYSMRAKAEPELPEETEASQAPTTPQETTPPETEPPETQPPETEPPETQPPNPEVDESWFDDVLFIGDSRMVGMRDYARLGEAEYFTSVGMSVFSVLSEWCSDRNFNYTQIEKLLQERSYGKIIIGLGINDSGYDDELILSGLQELIDVIQEQQPDTKVILHSIITVNRWKASAEPVFFALDNLYQLNEGIAALADGEHIFYIDPNSYFADEEGYLPDELSGDGCHFYAHGYTDWARWLKENIGSLGIS